MQFSGGSQMADMYQQEAPPPPYQSQAPANTTAAFSTPQSPPVATSSRPRSSGGPQLAFPSQLAVPTALQERLAPLEKVGKRYLAWIGCALLFIGTFPDAKTYSWSSSGFSFSASKSLWGYAAFWATVLVLLVIASAGIAFLRDYRWLLITGAASLLILILNFLYAFSGESVYSAHPSWAWILLFPGALLILAAGATRATPRDAPDDNGLNNAVASIMNRGS